MSGVYSSDFRSSRTNASPKPKRNEKPPFKLCFAKHPETGRSNACISKTNAEFITPKFYSREADCIPDEDILKKVKEIAEKEVKTPKQQYRWPVLTSHMYGWWHDKGIRSTDERFNFHKKTSDLVNFQMKIYSEDRKIKGFGQ